ncbi:MAG: hypothetical protein Kow006_30140 [Gammaproteobacteria bacterium]
MRISDSPQFGSYIDTHEKCGDAPPGLGDGTKTANLTGSIALDAVGAMAEWDSVCRESDAPKHRDCPWNAVP